MFFLCFVLLMISNQQLCYYLTTDPSYFQHTVVSGVGWINCSQQSVKIALKQNKAEFTKMGNGKSIFLQRKNHWP